MNTNAVVKKAGNTAIKFGAATAGLTLGSIVANKIPVPAVGPLWLQNILQKAAPGVLVMLLAYLASVKFKDENMEAGAVGMGLAGFANIVKNFAPDLAKFIPLNGLGNLYVPPGMPNMNAMAGLRGTAQSLQYQLGEGPSLEPVGSSERALQVA